MSNTAPRSTFDPVALAASVAAAVGGATHATPAASKDKATIYLGIGTLRDGVDTSAEDFVLDPVKDIINLPQMTGLDNMRPDDRKAGTQEFANQQAERNELLSDLVEEALATMKPGETRILPLYVTVYRKKDDVVAEAPAAPRAKKSFFAA